MKTTRVIATTLLAMSLLVSCGGGDDPVAPDKPDQPDTPDQPTEPSVTKRLTKIQAIGKENQYTVTLTYDKDKLSKYYWIYDDEEHDVEFNQSISYAEGKVTMKGEVDGRPTTQTYLLNTNGQATSCTYSYGYRDIKANFEYTPAGYLTKVMVTDTNTENHQVAVTTTDLTYSEDNNLMKGTEIYSDSYGKDTDEFTFTYGGEVNELGILDYYTSGNTLFDFQAAFYAGILGHPCKKLANICTEDKFSVNFSYTLNQDEKYLEQNASGASGYWHKIKYYFEE